MVRTESGRRLVIAFFEASRARDVASLMLLGGAPPEETRGTVGVLALDDRDRVDVPILGDRTTDDGPGIGAVIGAIGLALAGRDPPRHGPFFDAGSDLSTDDIARFGAELEAGQAAVAVLERGGATALAVLELTGLGGKTEVHWLTSGALRLAALRPPIVYRDATVT